jgi:TrmH family RNA methyltransferase
MITKKLSQLVRSLHQKKYRKQEQLFLVEGAKSVLELLEADYAIKTLLLTQMFFNKYADRLSGLPLVETDAATLERLGTLQTNDSALAVVAMKPNLPFPLPEKGWTLVLDGINDPGNLGTLLRIADWYGLKKLICSTDTVDLYNPKVIAASKGSFSRVQAWYTDLHPLLNESTLPAFGADMQGANIHRFSFPEAGLLVLGGEANGIRPEIRPLLSGMLSIPAFGKAESLNVAMAGAILCDNLRRQHPGG